MSVVSSSSNTRSGPFVALLRQLPAILICVICQPAASSVSAEQGIQTLFVEPLEINLRGNNRTQQVLVTQKSVDGRLLDVTHLSRFEIAHESLARMSASVVCGLADGETRLIVRHENSEVEVPVHILGVAGYPPVDFANDVLPILSKQGCNNGGCHGKASGQNGFKLSVFGFDVDADFDSLVKEARGRRVFPASPERSLLLSKPAGHVPHGGGLRLEHGSPDYELLLAWICQGTPRAQPGTPQLQRITVSPLDRVLATNSQQQILTTAHYSDGGTRDVTAAAHYTSNAPLVADVQQGLVHTGQAPGEAAVTVQYMGQVASVQLQVPRAGQADANAQPFLANNAVDELVAAKLAKMNLSPSRLCDDATFLRRVWIDTIGTLPTPDEVREFLAEPAADKRGRWIDRALDRPEYADYWSLVWADILLVDRQKLGEHGAHELHRWLRRQFDQNLRYDVWVTELITASGNSALYGPANLYRAVDTPEEAARSLSQAFLGVRLECAQCHHHPFEKWSQDDFYAMAGFFNGLERKVIAPGRALVYHAGVRETRIPISNKPVALRPLGAAAPLPAAEGDPRVLLARWMTAAQNPWFAKLAANRMWKHFLGRGLVEPEDDLRSTNPSTNEPLLQLLADRFSQDFDLKVLMRLILNSRTYQLAETPNGSNADDEQNFSRHYVRRMPAEVMLDAICQAAGSPESFVGSPPGTRAIELWDNRLPQYFLEIFGRPERTSPCECGRTSEPTMSQALHLMNAPEIESKIAGEGGRVDRLLAANADEARIVEELCLATLGRPPGARENAVAHELFVASPPRQAAEDFLWTLLNSYDFLFVK